MTERIRHQTKAAATATAAPPKSALTSPVIWHTLSTRRSRTRSSRTCRLTLGRISRRRTGFCSTCNRPSRNDNTHSRKMATSVGRYMSFTGIISTASVCCLGADSSCTPSNGAVNGKMAVVLVLYILSRIGTYKSSSPSPFSFIKIMVVVGWATMVRPGPIPQSLPSGKSR